jgi:predicted transcriptional regulator
MPTMTLAVPDELKKKMEKFPEMNWSEVARQAIRQRVEMLETLKEFTKDSTMTEEDALEMGRKVNKALAKRYLG